MERGTKNNILVLNAGSSSIKFAIYTNQPQPEKIISGAIKNIGEEKAEISIRQGDESRSEPTKAPDFQQAMNSLLARLETGKLLSDVQSVGHRIVHGLHHSQTELITDQLLSELESITSYDPDHLPAELAIVRQIAKAHPNMRQYACFDTAFHTTIPETAKRYPIPEKYYTQNVQRYGFHGLSYAYLMRELSHIDAAAAKGRIILAHLGNGASLAAVEDGQSRDTSMGFTPAAGIPMSTRSGDLDPGIAWYMMKEGIDARRFNEIINHESGLLGISGTSGNVQTLLEQREQDDKAALALDVFCYQIRKFIGAYMAVLHGLDILVFSGGIGENSAIMRSAICKGFGYAGIQIDEAKNIGNEKIISTENSKVTIFVIPTDEEKMIAIAIAALQKDNSHSR